MTHYEVIKNASVEEMAAILYAIIAPFIEDYTKEEKKEAYSEIKKMLERR